MGVGYSMTELCPALEVFAWHAVELIGVDGAEGRRVRLTSHP
jgi:hypothetical protein